jgi:hypothetical protein
MSRLTNSIRQDVLKKILDKTFEQRLRKIESEESHLSFVVRDWFLGHDKDAYLALRPKLQVHRTSIEVNPVRMGKTYDRYNLTFHPKAAIQIYNVSANSGSQCVSLHISYNGQEPVGGERFLTIQKDGMTEDIRNKIIAHIEKFEHLRGDIRKLAGKILAQLQVCTTIKKLNEVWPEVVSYVPVQDNPIAVIVDRKGVNDLIACMKKDDCPQEK